MSEEKIDFKCFYCGNRAIMELWTTDLTVPYTYFIEQPRASCGCILAPTKEELIQAVKEFRKKEKKEREEKDAVDSKQ